MSRASAGRREVFGAGAALLLLAASEAGTAKAAEVDGELLATCAVFSQATADLDRINGRLRLAISEEDADAAVERWHEAGYAVAAIRPRTPEGVRALGCAAATAFRIDGGADGEHVTGTTLALLAALFDTMGGEQHA